MTNLPAPIAVLLRDLDVALPWTAKAREGNYEVDALLGYVAGVPTYATMPWKPAALEAWVARLRADLEQAGA